MKQLTRADETLLIAVHCLGEEAYSSTILVEMATRVGKSVTVGSLWVSLDALSDKGYVRKDTRAGDSGGRPRVYYTLTPKGRRALLRAREHHDRLWQGVPPL